MNQAHWVCWMAVTSKRERLKFLAQRHHARCRRKTGAIADLAGMAVSYYNDFRNGRRPNIGLAALRRLCEQGWALSAEESLSVFTARVLMDRRLTQCLPVSFYWRVAAYSSLEKLATAAGVTTSHVARILHGQRFPSYAVMLALCRALGYTDDEAAVIFSDCHRQRNTLLSRHTAIAQAIDSI